ncbi:LPXTG cell wall anchor domain-containing protein [Enterococcus larvae]|uniref:LPXTG cell wall anchor domain-containing protein n=1 Tax=Enterococcus larvae TaxID=2794352 RepID=UPI003F3C4D42
MRYKKIIVLFCSWVVILSIFSTPVVVHASDGAGGQVKTGGKISFYEGSTTSSSTESTTSDEPNTSQPSTSEITDSATVEKPAGKYPSTGELIKNYSFIGSSILLILLSLLFLRKRREGDKP